MDVLQGLAFDVAQSPWVYPVVIALSAMDAFTIVLPSETVLAGLSSTSVSLGAPNLVFLGLAAILGAHLGDLGVFMIGRLLAQTRYFLGSNRVTRLLDWTRRRLDTQGPVYIMTARYIPYGRLLVNAAAGSSGFPAPRFIALSLVGCVIWASLYVSIGAGAGWWLGQNWWLGVLGAVVVAVALGFAVDRVLRRNNQV